MAARVMTPSGKRPKFTAGCLYWKGQQHPSYVTEKASYNLKLSFFVYTQCKNKYIFNLNHLSKALFYYLSKCATLCFYKKLSKNIHYIHTYGYSVALKCIIPGRQIHYYIYWVHYSNEKLLWNKKLTVLKVLIESYEIKHIKGHPALHWMVQFS